MAPHYPLTKEQLIQSFTKQIFIEYVLHARHLHSAEDSAVSKIEKIPVFKALPSGKKIGSEQVSK